MKEIHLINIKNDVLMQTLEERLEFYYDILNILFFYVEIYPELLTESIEDELDTINCYDLFLGETVDRANLEFQSKKCLESQQQFNTDLNQLLQSINYMHNMAST